MHEYFGGRTYHLRDQRFSELFWAKDVQKRRKLIQNDNCRKKFAKDKSFSGKRQWPEKVS
jgi:hypothetical protein